ncbi:MAG: DUF4382 domain-containing protein [Sodalinema sp.]|uniref:DUF4382 domain-containing protein n=1 Tax=Sodalinema sp. TaxID=3080550 RepID=UPI00396F2CE4
MISASKLSPMALSALLLLGCSDPTTETTPDSTAVTPSEGSGTLAVYANGEEYAWEGMTSKDGWTLSFDNLYVHLSDVTAYQTNPPYEADGSDIEASKSLLLVDSKTVDLTEGNGPVLLGEAEADAGHYNALSWALSPAPDGPAEGHVMVLTGTAEQDGERLDFSIALDQPLAFACGEFIGDERKGILDDAGTADLEATIHLDHLFGTGDAPADSDLNEGALGFDPIAALADNGTVEVTSDGLMDQLSPEDQEKLVGILPNLGHVGEGHCFESTMGDATEP